MYNGVYPTYIRPYTGVKPKIVKRKEDGEQQSSNSSSQHETSQSQTRQIPAYTNATNFQLSGYRNIPAVKKPEENKQTINELLRRGNRSKFFSAGGHTGCLDP